MTNTQRQRMVTTLFVLAMIVMLAVVVISLQPGLLANYAELITDPAHTLVELTFVLVVDGLLLGILWPLIKRHFHRDIEREHKVLDEEHGVEHKDFRNVKVIQRRG